MEVEYLNKQGLNTLWAKIKNTFVSIATYSSRNQSVDNRISELEARITGLEAGGDNTPYESVYGKVATNNEIEVYSSVGSCTLKYIDSSNAETVMTTEIASI